MSEFVKSVLHNRSTVGIYDPDLAMREALRLKMSRWLSGKYFDSTVLHELRRVIRSIQGLPREFQLHRFPAELDALHCVPFKSLSPNNLKGSLLACCKQLGITMKTGPDLFGQQDWEQIVKSMERICEMPISAELAALHTEPLHSLPSPWVVSSILGQIEEVFCGETFNIDNLKRAAAGLEGLQGSPVRNERESLIIRQAWAGLYAQNGLRFDSMAAPVVSGFKDAVLTALCLNQTSACSMLGVDAWTEISAMSIASLDSSIEGHAPESEQPRYRQSSRTLLEWVLQHLKR